MQILEGGENGGNWKDSTLRLILKPGSEATTVFYMAVNAAKSEQLLRAKQYVAGRQALLGAEVTVLTVAQETGKRKRRIATGVSRFPKN